MPRDTTACTEAKKDKLKKIAKEMIHLQYLCRKDARHAPVILDNVTRGADGKYESKNDVSMSKLKSGDDGYEQKLKIRDEMDKARGIKRRAPRKMRNRIAVVEEESEIEPEVLQKCSFCRKEISYKKFGVNKNGEKSRVCEACKEKRKKKNS